MKSARTAALFTLGLMALLSYTALAGDAEVKTRFKLITPEIGKLDLDLEPLEEGESKTFTTDSGKEVTITRTEEGYTLDVDGKEIKIQAGGDNATAFRFETDGGAGHREVIVLNKAGEADATDHHVMIVTNGEDEDGKKVIRKHIVTRVDGKDGETVDVKVLGDGEAQVIELEGLAEALGESADGKPHVIVIRKSSGSEGGEHKIEVRVKAKAEKDGDEGELEDE